VSPPIQLVFEPPFPREVHAGTDVTLIPRLEGAAGVRVRPAWIEIRDESGVVRASGQADDGTPLSVRVPDALGEYVWTAAVAKEVGARSDEHLPTLALRFAVVPHPTSVAVWGVTSPVPEGDWLKAKIGVRCRAGCDMSGERFDVYDGLGAHTGYGTVGDTLWPGTQGLYWGEVALRAPSTAGIQKWSVRFEIGRASHESVAGSFTFRVDDAPECRVAVRAVCEEAGGPVEDVEVRLGSYARSTDASGVAVFAVPRGTFELSARKDGLSNDGCTVDVDSNRDVEIRMRRAPTYEEIARTIEADLVRHYV
jgi:hypothetical protein